MKILQKRIYEDYNPNDGFRILTDRLWARGVKKENSKIDLWAKDIAPSSALRKALHHGELEYEKFAKLYYDELLANDKTDEFFERIKNEKLITLLTASKDIMHSHVGVLERFILAYFEE